MDYWGGGWGGAGHPVPLFLCLCSLPNIYFCSDTVGHSISRERKRERERVNDENYHEKREREREIEREREREMQYIQMYREIRSEGQKTKANENILGGERANEYIE